MKNKILNLFILILLMALTFTGCGGEISNSEPNNTEIPIESTETEQNSEPGLDEETAIIEKGTYTDPYEVADYIHTYNKLPSNFITKKEAIKLGWESDEGNLWEVTDEMSIGGDSFGNREGILPKKDGRRWYECDVNYTGGYRDAERIVYSNDGLIYYTDDHYETFTQLY